MLTFEQFLIDQKIVLPDAAKPAANYLPYLVTPPFVWISGQLPFQNGKLIVGKLGEPLSVQEGYEAARLAALQVLAQLKEACENRYDRFKRCVKITGYVNSALDFFDHPHVINGASDLIYGCFGNSGKHTRVAVGCASLPFNAAVEIDAIFELNNCNTGRVIN